MKEYKFIQVDVFTDKPFGGNPLAVFPDAEGLTGDEMQELAREMNLSESSFVFPPEAPEADFKVRIFTPGSEIPFAGHPVVGTHWVLANLGRVKLRKPLTQVHFELGVGVLPADLHVSDGEVQKVMMTQSQPTFQAILKNLTNLSEGLGLDEEAISQTELPVQVVSTGMPHMIVPVRSLAEVQAVDSSGLNVPALNRACRATNTETVLIFSFETERKDTTVHARFFAPLHGVTEDPATGSANGALGAYLVRHQAVPTEENPTTHIISEQGAEMGRPSTLYVEVDTTDQEITTVRVGGRVVPVIEGKARFR